MGHVSLGQESVQMSKCWIACASIALLFFHSLATVEAQSSELAGVTSLMEHGNLVEAEQRLQRYLLKLPHSARANSLLGELYFRQGRYQQAEDVLQKAIASAPGLVEPRLNLGDSFLAEG